MCLASLASGGLARAQDVQNLAMERIALAKQGSVFLENKGQYVPDVKFLYRTKGLDMWILGNAVVYDMHHDSIIDTSGSQVLSNDFRHSLCGSVTNNHVIQRTGTSIRMEFENASSSLTASGDAVQPGLYNYLIGNDSTKWATNVRRFGGARIQNLYEGIDAAFYLDNGFPRYDLIVQPGTDPSKICMNFKGQDGLSIDDNGNLIIRTSMGDLTQRDLYAYQIDSGKMEPIACRFLLDESGNVRFDVGSYDHSLPLIIDPLLYSTYLGGFFNDYAVAVAADSKGNAYVAGWTLSFGQYPLGFPTTPGAYQTESNQTSNFVTKLNSTGTALIYSTYLGSNGGTIAIAVDTSGDAFIGGNGRVPTTLGAYSTSGATFVTKLDQSGSKLLYSTLFGANAISSLAIDPQGCTYITGAAAINQTPTTPGAYKSQYPPSQEFLFIAKFNPSGSGLVYSTCFGSAGFNNGGSIAVDSSGNAYITGTTTNPAGGAYPTTAGAFQSKNNGLDDVFVTKLNSTGSDLVYSTLLGGDGVEGKGQQVGNGIAVDRFGNAYVMGWTESTLGGIGNFPTTPNAFQHQTMTPYVDSQKVFVTKVNSTGTALIYSTLLGGENYDVASGFTIDTSMNAYIAGWTKSHHYPTTPDAFQSVDIADSTAARNTGYDGIVTELNATGSGLIYSTYLGGESENMARGIALDDSGDIYVVGQTTSAGTFPIGFPVTPGVFQPQNNGGYDGFVTKFGPNKVGTMNILSYKLDTLAISICNSAEDSVTILNLGGSGMVLDSAQVAPPFSLQGGQFPFDLSTGMNLIILTRINPVNAGSISAPLTLFYRTSDGMAHDTVITLIANVGTQIQIHREAASAFYGQIDSLTLAVDLGSQINIDSLWPYITEIQATYSWDSTVVSEDDYLPPTGWSVKSLSGSGNTESFVIRNVSSVATQPLNLGTALFLPISTQLATGWVELPSLIIDAGNQALSLCVTDNEDNHWSVKTLGVQSSVAEVPVITQDLSIYPNPATDELFVQNLNEFSVSIEIYDAIGRVVLSATGASASTTTIPTQSLQNGVYFFRATNGSGFSTSSKVVIVR